MTPRPLVLLCWLALTAVSGLHAQGAADAFLDADARALHARARARWRQVDGSLVRYQAVASQRVAVALRLPLRDRTLFASETSARIVWERDGGVAVQMLAAAEQTPWARAPKTRRRAPLFDGAFDPAGDPLLLGLGDWNGDIPFVHPLDAHAEDSYRFRTADTLVLGLPDGRSVRAVQLDVLPRRDDPHLLSGALWIEPESGSVVRAVYRLARTLDLATDLNEVDDEDLKDVPGVLKPLTVDVTEVAVDYSLWDVRVWMPRSLRVEGTARAGIVRVPASLEMAFDVEEVVTDADTVLIPSAPGDARTLGPDASFARLALDAEQQGETTWKQDARVRHTRGREVRYLVPADPAWLTTSPHLPEPIWRPDAAFVSPVELDELKGVLADLPSPPVTTLATLAVAWQGPDLLRYNRVEGLSVGARGAVRFGALGGPMSASLTARLGVADRAPRGSLELTREGFARTTTLSAYRELQLVDPSTRALGLGNSAAAFLLGRDDGDYFESTGAALAIRPPAVQRPSWMVRLYAERQEPVRTRTDASVVHWLGRDAGFRPVAPTLRADQAGAELTLQPSWGHDPQSATAGLDLQLLGERGDFGFGRARLDGRAALPLPRGARLALAAGAGRTFGDAPPQRLFVVGGPFSVRGFAPGVRTGPTFATGRAELLGPLRRLQGARAVRLALFGDAGWAGRPDEVLWADAVASAGAGLSVLDGIIRLDLARAVQGPSSWRLDFYLDGLL